MTTEQPLPLNRVPLIISLILAISLVVGVLVGARIVYDRAARQPVAMSVIDSPDAAHPACAQFIDALPAKVGGHRRVDLVDPAPVGAAAWASDSTSRVTLRCGVSPPLQYTTLSGLTSAAGTQWLRIVDSTPGSDVETWYGVSRFPIVAVTTTQGSGAVVDDLAQAMSVLEDTATQPNPAPLSTLSSGGTEQYCTSFMAALPRNLGDHELLDVASTQEAELDANSAAWVADGQEPIVVRCGVAPPAGYAPGAQLQQVNDIAWFEDTTLANGTTAGTWFALGRDAEVAVSMPQTVGNAAIVQLSAAISEHVPAAG